VQGFSGVQFAPDSDGATFWFLSDNGFGGQSNSTDYLLRLYQVDPSFIGSEDGDGSVDVQGFVQLSDPNNLIPFDIINEDTPERLLTGGDFDIESFVLADNGDIWIGEEFGPFILRFDSEGVLLKAPIATPSLTELNTLNGQAPLVIGHRGASGDFPEHTLEAYRAAIAAGADFIEPDLAITSDGVLIARHEPTLAQVELDETGEILLDAAGNPVVQQNSTLTTNVADLPQYADRLTVKNLDGALVGGWFAEDFTFAELAADARARQSRDFRDQAFNDLFQIPSLEQVIELVQQVEAETGVQIGIYPETKHPTFFDEQNLSLEEPLVQTLVETGFTDPDRIFIQSFEIDNLLDLQELLAAEGLSKTPLVQLFGDTNGDFINAGGGGFSVPYDVVANVESGLSAAELAAIYGDLAQFINFDAPTYGDLTSQAAIAAISSYASGLGPWKNNILLRKGIDTPVDGNGDGVAEITTQLTGEIFPLIDRAHEAGLQVHPYTLRDEERFLTLNPDGTPQTPEEEYEQLIAIGADGFFTDFPRTGDPVRDRLVAD
ncbi:MAG: glycerophosphodiester phosphodiesterase family protein, partial [Cyanobacteria bacterium P01_E01_bin.43]